MGGLILLFLINLELFKATALTFVHPITFLFSFRDTIYIFTNENMIFKSVFREEKLYKVDSLFTNIKGIKGGYFDGEYIYLINDYGIFKGKKDMNFSLIKKGKPVSICGSDSFCFVLFKDGVSVIKKGRLIKEIHIKNNFLIIEPFEKDKIFVSGEGEINIIDFLRKKILFKYKNKNFSFLTPDSIKFFKEHMPLLRFNHIVKKDDYIFLVLGWNFKKSSSLILKIDGNYKLKKEKEINLIVYDMEKHKDYLIFAGYERKNLLGKIYIMNDNLEKLKELYGAEPFICMAKIEKDYFIFSKYQIGFMLINFKNTNKIYLWNTVIKHLRLFSVFLIEKRDFDGDSVPDFLFAGASSWSGPSKLKTNTVFIFLNRFPHTLSKIPEFVSKAKNNNNFWQAEKALPFIDEAIMFADFLMPESLGTYYKLRENIYGKIKLKRRIRGIIKSFINSIPLISFFVLIFIIGFLFLQKMDRIKPPPSAEVLKTLTKTPVIHEFRYSKGNLNRIEEINIDNLHTLRENIKISLSFLQNHKIRYSFNNSPLRWKKIYNKLIFELYLLNLILYFVLKFKKADNVPPLWLKKTLSIVGNITQNTVEKLIEMIEENKKDIIKDALLPAIENIRNKYRGEVLINTRINYKSPYHFFQSEIEEFKLAFLSIIGNAVESYEPERIPKKIDIDVESGLDSIVIKIKDYGCGIRKEDIDKIFTPGFTTKGKDRGKGLTDVDKFLKRYGNIKILSEPGKGTEFIITLLLTKIIRT